MYVLNDIITTLVLAGKLAAEVVSDRAAGLPPTQSIKEIQPSVYERAAKAVPKEPLGVKGEGAIAFGGGAVLSLGGRTLLEESDPLQLVPSN